MRISDWSSDVCSSDLLAVGAAANGEIGEEGRTVREHVDRIAFTQRFPGGSDLRPHPSVDARLQRKLQPPHGAGLAAVAQLLRVGERCGEILPLAPRSEEHTSELQSLMRISYAAFCL